MVTLQLLHGNEAHGLGLLDWSIGGVRKEEDGDVDVDDAEDAAVGDDDRADSVDEDILRKCR
jgi:hypothetical protein